MNSPATLAAGGRCAWTRALGGLLLALLACPARPCTTLFLHRGDLMIVANNYDYYASDGRVTVNRRGLRKTVFSTNSGLQWVSRFGSVTFNQWGHEFPNGGLNEAGLVVEQMMLEGSQYPNDARPSITETQWIQYQLDCSASVADVLASEAQLRIAPNSTPLHFLVADGTGDAAVIEFLGGHRVVHRGDSLPFAALTNHTYDESVAFAATTAPALASHTSSLGRFVHAAASVREFAQTPVNDPVGFAFAALDNVAQPNWTRWNTVCDIGARRVYYRTTPARAVKSVSLAEVDFRPRASTQVSDINQPDGGTVIPNTPYSYADNLAVLTSVYQQTTPFAGVPFSYLVQRAAYPDSIRPAFPPSFVAQPSSQTVAPGEATVLAAEVMGDGPLSYQWFRGSESIVGATAPTLVLGRVGPAEAGDYTLVATNDVASVTSRLARVVVAAPEPGRLNNMSVRAVAGAGGQPLIVGLVVSGGARPLLVRAVGPSLASLFSVPGALADSRLEVHETVADVDRIVATNDNWGANPAECSTLEARCAAVGAFPLAPTSRDAALTMDVQGSRTVLANGVPADSSGVVLVEAYDLGTDNASALVNCSARHHVGTGADVLIAGFVINGNVPRRVLVRGVGPSLSTLFGLTHVLVDPHLELHLRAGGRDQVIAANDDWADEPGAAEAAATVGAFGLPAGSRDAALVMTLPAGAYTAVLSGVNGTMGTGLVEIYDLDAIGRSPSRRFDSR